MTVSEYRDKQKEQGNPSFVKHMRGLLAVRDIGLDLGSDTTRLCLPDEGVVLSEPSAVTVRKGTGEVVRFGEQALRLLGRTSSSEEMVRPMKKGAIVDYNQALAMIQYFLRECCGTMLRQPRMLIAAPMSINDAEKRFLLMAAQEAGAKNVYLMESIRAAALGAGLDLRLPFGRLVADIGSETTDVAVLSLSGVVVYSSTDVAGRTMDRALSAYIRQKHGLSIGELRAEDTKKKIGCVLRPREERAYEVKGREISTGLPKVRMITATELVPALQNVAMEIVRKIQWVIARTPPELLPDLVKGGITLTGGGACLRGLPELISRQTGLSCTVCEESEDAVARGLLKTLPHLDEMEEGMLMSDFVHRRGPRGNY